MRSYHKEKLEKRIREALSQILVYEIEDPRLQACLINRVVCSPDFRLAKIYISIFGGPEAEKAGLQALRSASKFLQSHLASKIQVRFVPLLSFFLEEDPDKSLQSIKRVYKVLEEESELHSQNEEEDTSTIEEDEILEDTQ
ncbi:MAG: 30S ribosome-binding factor RbfA [Caldisericia bacterium]|nr:30S ribosome-binding factor RbfA [Caldisericia bacterium]